MNLQVSAKSAARVDTTLSYLQTLGEFSAGTDLGRVPPAVVKEAKLSLLDTVGCMVLGAHDGTANSLIATERELSAAKEATIIGTDERLSVEAAARVNGFNGDIFELNDLTGGHASIGTVSAALALAESSRSSGSQLVRAVIAGIETTSRVHTSFRYDLKPYADIGNAYIGFINTLGSAAVAASLFNLDAIKTANALAVAGALAGWCPAHALFRDGGSIKPILFGGWPASVGILGARYAKAGITGPAQLLEGDLGFLGAIAYRTRPEAVLAPGKWFLSEPRRKWHACCGYIHPAIDLVAALRKAKGNVIFRDAEIRISMIPNIIPAVSKPRAPSTPNEARFSLEYCLALVMAGEDIILPDHSTKFSDYLSDPILRESMSRISVVAEPAFAHYQECTVEVAANGSILARASGDSFKGSPNNPLSEREVVDKFARITKDRFDDAAARRYAKRVMSLENEDNCEWLFKLEA